MGIFSSIKNAIFGEDDKAAKTAPTPSPTPAQREAAATSHAVSEVDVAARLDAKPGADKLNWRTSIVDLLKLVGIESSYENRKELAQELGNTSYSGTAEDNLQLHKQVMAELSRNGGKVPAELMD